MGNDERLDQDTLPAFEEFTEDEALAKEYGVRVAQYEAPSVNMKPGQVWEVSIDAAGGLNLKMLASEPSASPAHERQISMATGG